MQLYAVNFISLLSSLYMLRAAHTPIITPTYDCTSGCRYSCTTDDGRVCSPKHVEWTKQRNKIHCIQLHLLVISIEDYYTFNLMIVSRSDRRMCTYKRDNLNAFPLASHGPLMLIGISRWGTRVAALSKSTSILGPQPDSRSMEYLK